MLWTIEPEFVGAIEVRDKEWFWGFQATFCYCDISACELSENKPRLSLHAVKDRSEQAGPVVLLSLGGTTFGIRHSKTMGLKAFWGIWAAYLQSWKKGKHRFIMPPFW